jgi:signal transduction histidine kinase
MNPAANRDQPRLLFSELLWLMRLRWVAGACVLGRGGVNWQWAGWYPAGREPMLLGVFILVYNVVFWELVRRRPRLRRRFGEMVVFASLQILMDLASLTLVAMWTGGVLSPVMGFFVFHMLFAALLQPRARAYATAVSAILMLGTGLWMSGQWPRTEIERQIGLGWVGTVLVTIFLADRITQALYRREQSRVRQVERIRRMTSRLREQQQALVRTEKMAAMGQFAAGIAHEITNPLASMDSLLQLMQRNPASPRPEAVGALREQVQRIHRTIRQLTAYAHPGKGRMEAVSVNDVVVASLEMLVFDKRLDRARIVQELSGEAGVAMMNPQAIQQVLTNLILNALDATAGRESPRVCVSTVRERGWCVLRVEDNGSGIAEEHLGRLFEPFFTTKPVGQGTGLGLSISARLVREGGGEIGVTSRQGHGTMFTIRLPVAPLAEAGGDSNSVEGGAATPAPTATRGDQ